MPTDTNALVARLRQAAAFAETRGEIPSAASLLNAVTAVTALETRVKALEEALATFGRVRSNMEGLCFCTAYPVHRKHADVCATLRQLLAANAHGEAK